MKRSHLINEMLNYHTTEEKHPFLTADIKFWAVESSLQMEILKNLFCKRNCEMFCSGNVIKCFWTNTTEYVD